MDGSNQPHEPTSALESQTDQQRLSTEAAQFAEPVVEVEQQMEEAIDQSLDYTPQVEMPALVSPEDYTKDETLAHAVNVEIEEQKSSPLGAAAGLSRELRDLKQAQDELKSLDDGKYEGDFKPEVVKASLEGMVDFKEKEVEKRLQQAVSPYEKLYDLNPEHFSSLPTSEFMQVANDYRDLRVRAEWRRGNNEVVQQSVDVVKNIVPFIEGSLSEVDERDAGKYRAVYGIITGINRTLMYHTSLGAMGHDNANTSEFWNGFLDVVTGTHVDSNTFGDNYDSPEGTFEEKTIKLAKESIADRLDDTPRKKIERFAAFLEPGIAIAQQSLESAEQEVADFEAKYTPQPISVENQQ